MLWRGKADKIVWRRWANCISHKSPQTALVILQHIFTGTAKVCLSSTLPLHVFQVPPSHLPLFQTFTFTFFSLIFSHLAHCGSIPSIPDHPRIHHFLKHTSVSSVFSTLNLKFKYGFIKKFKKTRRLWGLRLLDT